MPQALCCHLPVHFSTQLHFQFKIPTENTQPHSYHLCLWASCHFLRQEYKSTNLLCTHFAPLCIICCLSNKEEEAFGQRHIWWLEEKDRHWQNGAAVFPMIFTTSFSFGTQWEGSPTQPTLLPQIYRKSLFGQMTCYMFMQFQTNASTGDCLCPWKDWPQTRNSLKYLEVVWKKKEKYGEIYFCDASSTWLLSEFR